MQPDLLLPNDAPADLDVARLQAIRDNAQRLGLTWRLRLATVAPEPAATQDVATVVVDGDSEPIQAVSMVGLLGAGRRVYVITSPPSGNHIVGAAGGSSDTYRDQIVTDGVVSSVTFTGIPSNLRSVTVHSTARADVAGAVVLYARVNSDSDAASYFSHVYGATSAAYITPTEVTGVGAMECGVVAGNNNPDEYGANVLTLTNWAQSSGNLVGIFQGTAIVIGAGYFSRAGGATYIASGPYTTLTLLPSSGSFEIGSAFSLIGNQT